MNCHTTSKFIKTNMPVLWRISRILLSLSAMLCSADFMSAAMAKSISSLGRTAVQGNPQDVGFFDILLEPTLSSNVGYVNIVSDLDRNGNTPNDWFVQNLPIPLQSGEFGEFSALFSTPFNLGGLTPSGNFDVYASFTTSPTLLPDLMSMQLTSDVPFSLYDIGNLQDGALIDGLDAGGGIDGADASSLPSTVLIPSDNKLGIIGRVRHDIPGILQAKNECAPTSATQSLLWLSSRQGLKGLPNQNDLINQLKIGMKWTEKGIIPGNFKPGKEKVIQDLKLPLITKQGGAFDGTGTFDFIKKEIEAQGDVEMRIQYPNDGGHWVTIAGWYDDGTKKQLYFKDPLTRGNAIDPYELDGTLIKNYKYGNGARISFAVSEVPEPLTILGTGVVLGALPVLKKEYAKKKKKKDGDA